MSEVTAFNWDSDRLTETRQPFDLSGEMLTTVDRLGIANQIAQLRDEGYSIIEDIAEEAFSDRLRETCIRLAQETEGGAKGYSAALLLGRDPIFEDVVLHPKIRALTEIMCGKGALLSQLICSIRPQGAPSIGLHADQNWFPAPFPEHNQLFTLCWTMDPYTEAAGCTGVIPGSHKLRRHPNEEETARAEGLIPTTTGKNAIVFWDGSVWHSNYPRQEVGERVVLHITFSRLQCRPVENYDHLGEDWLEGKDPALRTLLGRDDMLGTTTIERGYADYTKLPRTFNWAKT